MRARRELRTRLEEESSDQGLNRQDSSEETDEDVQKLSMCRLRSSMGSRESVVSIPVVESVSLVDLSAKSTLLSLVFLSAWPISRPRA